MRRAFALLALLPAVVVGGETQVQQVQVPVVKCSSPVKSIAIAQVECTAATCQAQANQQPGIVALASLISGEGGVAGVGRGVKSMMTNAIKETGCFKIIDLEQVQKMKAMLEATGQTVKPPQIDLYINGQITAIQVNKSKSVLGGGYIPFAAAFSTSSEEADMTMDIAAMDPSTLEIGDTKSFSANSSKTSWGFLGFGAGGGGGVGGGFSISKSLALDNVVREVVFNVTNYLAETYAAGNIIARPQPSGNVKKTEDPQPSNSASATGM